MEVSRLKTKELPALDEEIGEITAEQSIKITYKLYPIFAGMQQLEWYERFVIYGICGFAAEILFTSIWEALENGNRKMHGITSTYAYFIYGISISVQEQLYKHTKDYFSFHKRGLIYLIWSMSWECFVGLFLKRWNACPWDYATYFRCHFMGVITAEYIPVWYIACLICERYLIRNALQLCWFQERKQ